MKQEKKKLDDIGEVTTCTFTEGELEALLRYINSKLYLEVTDGEE